MTEYNESEEREESLRSIKEIAVPLIMYSTPIVILSGWGIKVCEIDFISLLLYGVLVLSVLALCCGIARLYIDHSTLKTLTSITLLEHETLSNREE